MDYHNMFSRWKTEREFLTKAFYCFPERLNSQIRPIYDITSSILDYMYQLASEAAIGRHVSEEDWDDITDIYTEYAQFLVNQIEMLQDPEYTEYDEKKHHAVLNELKEHLPQHINENILEDYLIWPEHSKPLKNSRSEATGKRYREYEEEQSTKRRKGGSLTLKRRRKKRS
jgi:hypothetical protein